MKEKDKDKDTVYFFVSMMILFIIFLIGSISTGFLDLDKVIKTFHSATEQSYRDAVKELNFEAAHDVLSSYRSDYLYELSQSDHWDEKNAAQGKYYQAFDEIYKAETQYILSEFQGDECKDKILFLLEEIPIEGEKKKAGLCRWEDVCRSCHSGYPLDAYIIWTEHYNRLCNTILSLAINRKNQELAKIIIQQFVDNVEVTGVSHLDDEVKVDGIIVKQGQGYIKYTSEDRDAAKKKYDDAVRSGAFNE